MTTEEAQKVLNELQGVRPELLNDEAKRLFEAIMRIADERDSYKSMLEEKDIEYKELTEAEKAMSKLVNLMKKVINEMAEVICMLDTMNNYNTRNNDIEEVKEYFYKKVEDKR